MIAMYGLSSPPPPPPPPPLSSPQAVMDRLSAATATSAVLIFLIRILAFLVDRRVPSGGRGTTDLRQRPDGFLGWMGSSAVGSGRGWAVVRWWCACGPCLRRRRR